MLQRFREDSVVTSIPGGIDHKATAEQIEHIATLIPDEWLEPSATGSAQQCPPVLGLGHAPLLSSEGDRRTGMFTLTILNCLL